MARLSGRTWGQAGLAVMVLLGMAAGEDIACAAEPPYQKLALEIVGLDQGVFVRAANGATLAAVAADQPVHPASVTKVASTLALLGELGPEYRFATRVLASGPVQEGALAGDLLLLPGGDPFLVSENTLLMLAALRCMGIERVAGRVRVVGDEELVYNWAADAEGRRMAKDLAGIASPSAWLAVANAEPGLLDRGPDALGIRFAGRPLEVSGRAQPLIEHRSPPLKRILKELNGFSNNIFQPFSHRIGGPGEVQKHTLTALDPSLRDEVVIDNAAGAGKTNRLSPRAAAALVDALATELARHRLDLPDVLPVAGIDGGTLSDRFAATELRGVVVGKTGTIPSLRASALVGRARTRAHGMLTFAILNHGIPVPEARRRQDAFLKALIGGAGGLPWKYEAETAPPFAEVEIDALGSDRCDLPRPATPDRDARSDRATSRLGTP
jgi:D-alanyl-D-alanine carboxypeptidase/D-alanyl-D-alanine-endopeptidase (penicillin-binding protein 4)